jgi:transposase-like protein
LEWEDQVEQKVVVRYSEAFKLQVVRELEEGKHSSCFAAGEAYGIRGPSTVGRWARRYGREHLTKKVVRVETTGERDELRRLKERVRDLERALGDTTLDLRLEREYVKLACRQAGIDDVEAFKKKVHGKPSTTR